MLRHICFILSLAVILATPGGARVVVVRPGESLTLIAARELGSMDRWTELAEINNIRDPRRLQIGQRLVLPGSRESIPQPIDMISVSRVDLPPHIEGSPSVRRVAGGVRIKPAANDPWTDLSSATVLQRGAAVMTANTGRAEAAIEDLRLEISPFTILEADDVGDRPRLRLTIGEIHLANGQAPVGIMADGLGVLADAGATVRVALDDAGLVRVFSFGGRVEVQTRDGNRIPLEPGKRLFIRRGGAPEIRDFAAPIRLLAPDGRRPVAEENILFEWSAVAGARGYRFTLVPEDEARPRLVEEIQNPRIQVNRVPEGNYSWRVAPLGVADAVASLPARLMVDRARPSLELLRPILNPGGVLVAGRADPGASLRVGREEITADASGRFECILPPVTGIAVIGVEARTRPGGRPARAAVAISGRPENRVLPVAIMVPDGRVLIDDAPAPSTFQAAEGMNALSWQWRIGEDRVAMGRLEIPLDLTPPEIHAIASTPREITSGDVITVRVAAVDRGIGLGAPSTASLGLVGAGGFSATVAAESIDGGEYVFRVPTPRTLKTGVVQVSRLEIADADGNAIVLTAEGMAVEATNPKSRLHRFLSNVFLVGIGVVLGAL
jgi:hypothetical protein